MLIKNFLQKKPLISFFLLTYIISWSIWIPIIIYYLMDPFTIAVTTAPIFLVVLVCIGFFGPTFAALIISALQNGRNGIKNLLSRWTIWKIKIQWYLFIPIFFLLVTFIGIQLYFGFFSIHSKANLILLILLFPQFLEGLIFIGAIAEETGWRGYALPRLMKSKNALSSSIILGTLWACWHLPLNLITGLNIPVPLDLFSFLMFLFMCIGDSIIMTWLFNNTKGSVFICYLYHAASNSIEFIIVYNIEDYATAWYYSMWFTVIMELIFCVIIVAIYGVRYLSRKYKNKSDFLEILGIADDIEKKI